MHTFFINTANRSGNVLLDSENKVQRYLFANLIHRNRLIFSNWSLDDLETCAHYICELIDKDDNIQNDFNILIYVDVNCLPAKAKVMEAIEVMRINEDFASVLKQNGKEAHEMQIIFGESFDQNEQIGNDNLHGPDLWNAIGFPDIELIQRQIEMINLSQGDASDLFLGLSPLFAALLDENNNFTKAIVSSFLDDVSQKNALPQRLDLIESLTQAFSTLSKSYQTKYVGKLSHRYHFFQDKDEHQRNRSTYALYLYVFYCAINDRIPDLNDTVFNARGHMDVDWEEFALVIDKRRQRLRFESDHIQKEVSFAFLDWSAIGGEKLSHDGSTALITIEQILPSLSQENIKLSFFSGLHKTKNQQEMILEGLLTKNVQNESSIKDFLIKVRHDYNRLRTSANISSREGIRTEANKKYEIEYISMIEEQTKQAFLEVEEYIASQVNLQNSSSDSLENIQQMRYRTDYFFDCLEIDKFFGFISFLAVPLVFITPYVCLQYEELKRNQNLFYIVVLTYAIITLLFWAVFLIYRWRSLRKIRSEIRELVNQFNKNQKDREGASQAYKSRLSHFYPRSEIVHSYYLDVLKFQNELRYSSRLENYHRAYLSSFSRDYLDHLLQALDIRHYLSREAYQNDDLRGAVSSISKQALNLPAPSLGDIYYVLDSITIKQVMKGLKK